MRASLQEKCDRLVANDRIISKVGILEDNSLVKLGALLYLNEGATPDVERIRECRKILKSKTGIFSNFRGTLGFIVPIKMSLADDPAAYLDDALYIYESLSRGKIFGGEMLAMAALVIKDMCTPDRYDEVVDATRETYALMRKAHPFLTDEHDMVLIALLCIIGCDFEVMTDRAEDIFRELRACGVPYDAAQSASMVLALSERPTDQKVTEFVDLYNALRDAKHATARDNSMAIYAPFVDIDVDNAKVVSDIAEVDDWLKRQKGYGILGTGPTIRRVFAAALTLKDYEGQYGSAPSSSSVFAVAESVIEQVVIMVTLLILVTIMNTTAAASSSH